MSANSLILAAEEESHNPLLPATYDIVWSIVALAIVGLVFWKFVLPRAQEVLAERTDGIVGGLKRASDAQLEADALLKQREEQLLETRAVAAQIREDARLRGQEIIAELRTQGEAESARIVAAGRSQLRAERDQIVAELRADLGRTAVDLAEKIVGEHLEDSVKRGQTVDRFLADLDATSAQRK
ncbi:F0F1 ATP synthase subunit B [Nocardia sp. 348MFTsu5.1]|jgi:F-type H+-transporting ATPase subunit b|uniref:F0F1 ATP synthase subunit B n=1 Tax=Nocardia sp. 348MFTsu5.1 TaxID=1172185 RepID=UPI000377B25F|nr:F0F1 ATP synthase subunit B [Nocardia sp. 348MFTsu5.1]